LRLSDANVCAPVCYLNIIDVYIAFVHGAASCENYLKPETLSWLSSWLLRCYRRRGTQSLLRHCVHPIALATQENIFCVANARGAAKIPTAAKMPTPHRRNSGASPQSVWLCAARFEWFACVAERWFCCVACVTHADRSTISSAPKTSSKTQCRILQEDWLCMDLGVACAESAQLRHPGEGLLLIRF
jgi:hypothetical protein